MVRIVVGGDIVKDPRTGKVFGSVEEFVRRKGRPTFEKEFASLQRQKQERLNKSLQESKERTIKITADLRRQFNALNIRRDLSRNELFSLRRDLQKQIGFAERTGRNELANIRVGKFDEEKIIKVETPEIKRFGKEIFNPLLGAFVRPSDPSGQATGFIRVPTPDEQILIEEAERKGSFSGILETISKKEIELEKKLFGERIKGSPTREEQVTALKEGFPPVRVFEFGAEGFLKAGEFVTQSKAPPPARQLAKDVLEDVFIFATFSPFINSATAKKGSTEAKVTKTRTKKKVDKTKIDKLRDLREEIKTSSNDKVKSFIEKTVKEIETSKLTKVQKAERLRNLEIFVREARGQISIQDGKIVPIVKLEKLPVFKKVTKPTIVEVQIKVPKLIRLEKTKEILSATSIKNRLTVTKAKEKNKKRVEQAQKPLGQKYKEAQRRVSPLELFTISQEISQLTRQIGLSKNKQDSLSKQLLATKSLSAQKSLLKQMSALKSGQKLLSRQLSKQMSALKVAQKQVQRGRGIGKGIPRGRLLRRGRPFPIPFGGGLRRKAVKRLIETKKQGYNSFAKAKGKFKKLNKVPLTKTQARNLSAFIVDNSTSARGLIKRVAGKKALKPRTRIPVGYFSRTRKKYRTFKIVKGRRIPLKNEIIELRGKRIDTRGEKKGLSVARSLAKLRKLKPSPKIIKKSKRTSFKPDKSKIKSSKLIKTRRKK
ncbi:hypothetical protein LCGC14_0438860 [marine sediment metagenome]|uniref:Uncharacterized protein n=1 Tax=marine sediment metagenome TaxID=412755 RepID=A0A0F9VUZ8_9ZZZZ